MDGRQQVVEQVEVSATDIARIAGVRPSAVSNWRRRHHDFPKPVSGTDKSPRFDLAAVEGWLRSQGKAAEIPVGERLWQAFDSARGIMRTTAALVAAGELLLYLHRHPETPPPGEPDALRRLMNTAEHELIFGSGSVVAGLIDVRTPFDPGAREMTMLHAVAEAAAADDPAQVFEYLCSRVFDGGPRSGLAVTPPELAELMLDLAGHRGSRLFDPACGSGTIMLAAARRGYSRVEGQELDSSLALISALRLAFMDASFDVYPGDSLRKDAYQQRSADAVICNPPFADRNWGQEELADDNRWEYGVPSRLESELAWVQHALAHAVPGGSVVILMPPAAAARPSGQRLRANLLQRGALRAVISLPPKLAAHYALALQIWVLIRPEQDNTPSHVLLVDASGFSAWKRARPTLESAPAWDDVRALVTSAWGAFNEDPQQVATTSDVAIAVPVVNLLSGEVDLTPGRHFQSGLAAPVSRATLTARRDNLTGRLAELATLLPPVTDLRLPENETIREVTLEELAQTGALFIRRAIPRPTDDEKALSGPRIQVRILTGQDIARAVPPSRVGQVTADEVRNPAIREGDVLMPNVSRRLTARVATGRDVGAYLSSSVLLIRPDPATIDPWFLAGFLSSSDGGRQAARMASTLGEHIRFDPRRVQIPLLPIETQRTYGEAFRRLWEFARTFRAAHDEGIDFVRDMIDATAALLGGQTSTALNQVTCNQA
jgi:N-6 DNA Methylase